MDGNQNQEKPLRFAFEERSPSGASIKVIGVGGGGCNAVNRMIEAGIEGVDFIAANTDLQALRLCKAAHKLQLGEKITKGLGVGSDPEKGKQATLEDTDRIIELLDGADMVFVTAGLGGGTGTGGAPIVASLATELGALTVAVVTTPFRFEGHRRMKQAQQGLEELRESADTVITIPNERLLTTAPPNTSFFNAFKIADDVLRQAVQGISDLITIPGVINLDFADVRTIMSGMGLALMGTGVADGDDRAVTAARRAISSPLLEDLSIQGARGILLNITGSSGMTLQEVSDASQIIHQAAHPESHIIFGTVCDENLGTRIKITVIATGFDRDGDGHSQEGRGRSSVKEEILRPKPVPVETEPDLFGSPVPEVKPEPVEDPDIPTFFRRRLS